MKICQNDSKAIFEFLSSVDHDFPVPNKKKVNLLEYAEKLIQKASLFAVYDKEKITALVAGYTVNLSNEMAYVAVVSTRKEYRGHGLAEKLLKEFLEECQLKSIKAVHLYTQESNSAAVRLYLKLGFETYSMPNEPRPNDLHLIHFLSKSV